MNWFYADNGQQRGPVSEAEFDALVASGSIQPATLVAPHGAHHLGAIARATLPQRVGFYVLIAVASQRCRNETS